MSASPGSGSATPAGNAQTNGKLKAIVPTLIVENSFKED